MLGSKLTFQSKYRKSHKKSFHLKSVSAVIFSSYRPPASQPLAALNVIFTRSLPFVQAVGMV